MKRSFFLVIGAGLVLALLLARADGQGASFPYKVSGAFVRATPAKISAGYMTIKNPTKKADALVRVTAPWAARTELHTIEKDSNGILTMKEVKAMKLPAKGALALKNGGYHIMFYGVKKPLVEETKVPVTLYFKSGLKTTLEVIVKPITYKP